MTFAMAQQLAFLATDIDEAKDSFAAELIEDAQNCVSGMHKLARALAGARAGEIYDASEEQQATGLEETCV